MATYYAKCGAALQGFDAFYNHESGCKKCSQVENEEFFPHHNINSPTAKSKREDYYKKTQASREAEAAEFNNSSGPHRQGIPDELDRHTRKYIDDLSKGRYSSGNQYYKGSNKLTFTSQS